MSRSLRLLALAPLLLLLASCHRADRPDAAYRAFVDAVAARNAPAAWERLSQSSQRWLEERAKQAAAAAPGVVAPGPEAQLLGDAASAARPVTSIVVLRESEDRAVLKVEERGGGEREVTMVKEGTWKVEVPPPEAAAR